MSPLARRKAAEVALLLAGLALAARAQGRGLSGAGGALGATVLDSGRPGALIAIVAGIHGDEPSGVEAALAVAAGPPPGQGVLILVPAANPAAVEAGARAGPSGRDLNRLFPGGEGNPEAEAAARLFSALAGADLVVDLHESGPAWTETPGPALVANGPAAALLLDLVDSLGEAGFSAAGSPPAGSLSAELGRAGVAALTVEVPAALPAGERLGLQLGAVRVILALFGLGP